MEKQTIVMVALVLLILITAMQSVQLSNIQNKLSGNTVQSNTPAQQVLQPIAQPQQLPSNLQQLPQQVGGC
ncbi:MAG: hypothetical protein QMD85_05830 [Candidatus Aenigmarchaeota archaeon]|nr:hypothetical protein [Candidatus Aenigmarchaeota archaeon]